MLLGVITVNAQNFTTKQDYKKTVLDISEIHFCKMHTDDIMKNVEGVQSYELSSCGKYLTVYYDESKTNPDKLYEDVKAATEVHHKVCTPNEHKKGKKCHH